MRDEGVIKFECRFSEDTEPQGEVVDELCIYRNRLFDINLIGVYEDGIGFGNISARQGPGRRQFIISASQTGHIACCSARHFVLVDDYSIPDNRVACRGALRASSESLTHALIYEAVPEANAVIHVHSGALWSKLKDVLPTSADAVPYGTPAMAGEVRRLLEQTDLLKIRVFVMGGHEDGIVSFGASLADAWSALERFVGAE